LREKNCESDLVTYETNKFVRGRENQRG